VKDMLKDSMEKQIQDKEDSCRELERDFKEFAEQ
jgi:hypothetical protein